MTPLQRMIFFLLHTMDKYRDHEFFHDELVGLKVFAMLFEQEEKQSIIDAVDVHRINLRDLYGTSDYNEVFIPDKIL